MPDRKIDEQFRMMFRRQPEGDCDPIENEPKTEFAASMFRPRGTSKPRNAKSSFAKNEVPQAHWQTELAKLTARYGEAKATELFVAGKTFADALLIEVAEKDQQIAALNARIKATEARTRKQIQHTQTVALGRRMAAELVQSRQLAPKKNPPLIRPLY